MLTVACAFAANYTQLVAVRGLMGLMLGGLPAVAMAYLGDEIEPTSLGLSMGMYISGSAFGGKTIRVSFALLGFPACIELCAVLLEPRRHVKQLEIVGLQGNHTRKDSPQPQRSRSLGLLKRKPSFRPSRTKSSSVPSM